MNGWRPGERHLQTRWKHRCPKTKFQHPPRSWSRWLPQLKRPLNLFRRRPWHLLWCPGVPNAHAPAEWLHVRLRRSPDFRCPVVRCTRPNVLLSRLERDVKRLTSCETLSVSRPRCLHPVVQRGWGSRAFDIFLSYRPLASRRAPTYVTCSGPRPLSKPWDGGNALGPNFVSACRTPMKVRIQ